MPRYKRGLGTFVILLFFVFLAFLIVMVGKGLQVCETSLLKGEEPFTYTKNVSFNHLYHILKGTELDNVIACDINPGKAMELWGEAID